MPRRLTDRSLPPGLSSISPDATLFDELLEMEKKLDWTMTRRRQELTDSLHRGSFLTRRTLRIYLSHTVNNQTWQKSSSGTENNEEKTEEGAEGEEAKEGLESGQNVPSWTFKIEGKLLEPEHVPRPKHWPLPERKFSQMLKSLSIEMDRDPNVYADTNHVQWTPQQHWAVYSTYGFYPHLVAQQQSQATAAASATGTTGTDGNAGTDSAAPASASNATPSTTPVNPAAPLDGFTLTRSGDAPTALRITLHVHHNPERFRLPPVLAQLLGIYEDTRGNICGAFWHYVKANGLQDKNDRKLIKLDDKLRAVFKYESLNFQDIITLLNMHLTPPDPIMLRYEIGTHCIDPAISGDVEMSDSTGVAVPKPGGIGVDKDGKSGLTVYDVALDMDDLWMRAKAGEIIMSMQPDTAGTAMAPASSTGQFNAILKADDEIKQRLQELRLLRMRRDFFTSLAENPSKFMKTFVESQARDLEVIYGNERAAEGGGSGGNAGLSVHESDLMRSDFFHEDWVYEGVGVYEALRMGNTVSQIHQAAHQQANMNAGMGMPMGMQPGVPPPMGMGMMGPPGGVPMR